MQIGGAGGAFGRSRGHVTIVKRIDKATPLLFERCSDGRVLALVTVELTRGGIQTYLKDELKEVLVSPIAHRISNLQRLLGRRLWDFFGLPILSRNIW